MVFLDSAAHRIRLFSRFFSRLVGRFMRLPKGGRVGASFRLLRGPIRRAVPAAAAFIRGDLAAAGNRNGTTVNNAGSNGNYWSSSLNDATNARNVNFNSGNVNPQNNNNRYNGFSVRLVRVSIACAALVLAVLAVWFFICAQMPSASTLCLVAPVGPFCRPRRHQRPFRECMGEERYARALREEFRPPEVQAWLEANLFRLLYDAYKSARESNRNSYGQCRFEMDLFKNLSDLKRDLLDGTYRCSRCVIFIVFFPVRREVIAPAFRDEVVDHLLYGYLYPIFDKLFICDSYSCRLGKGTSFGIDRLEHHIRSVSCNYTRPAWVLSWDLSGYFMSIDHGYLYDRTVSTLIRKGHRGDLLYSLVVFLVRIVIFTDPTVNCVVRGSARDWIGLPANKSYFNCDPDKGLPIGKLPCQLFSSINLDEFDQFLKRDLGAEHCGHYVDDYYDVERDPSRALSLLEPAERFLQEVPKLRIHPRKVRLYDVRLGVPFLGVVLRPGRRTVSRRAQVLMVDKFSDALAVEKDIFRLEAQRASCGGYLLTKQSRGIRDLVSARPW